MALHRLRAQRADRLLTQHLWAAVIIRAGLPNPKSRLPSPSSPPESDWFVLWFPRGLSDSFFPFLAAITLGDFLSLRCTLHISPLISGVVSQAGWCSSPTGPPKASQQEGTGLQGRGWHGTAAQGRRAAPSAADGAPQGSCTQALGISGSVNSVFCFSGTKAALQRPARG